MILLYVVSLKLLYFFFKWDGTFAEFISLVEKWSPIFIYLETYGSPLLAFKLKLFLDTNDYD